MSKAPAVKQKRCKTVERNNIANLFELTYPSVMLSSQSIYRKRRATGKSNAGLSSGGRHGFVFWTESWNRI